ncbi:MAG: hypothetical protein J6I38_04905 [Prevotella sp.]|nr:hypothetical protein [Prevotella sp.]
MKKTVVRTKRLMILAMMMVMTISANAARPLVACYQRDARMSYNAAKNEALFLSDKMAYELNLTAAQYEAVYEINLDYLMSLNGNADVFGIWWDHRNADLRYVLNSWQYDKYVALSHFYRPVAWKAGSWTFAVYSHYNRGHFYNDRPTVFVTYKGGHNRIHGSHYAHMHKPAVHHHAPAVHHPAPAPHHPNPTVKVVSRNGRGISNHTLENNTPRHGHSSAGHFGGRR